MKILISFLIQTSLYAFASDCQQYIGQCDYYTCVAAQKACAQDNYLLKFSKTKCQCFVDEKSDFSETSQVVLRNIRECLQFKIENDWSQLTCDNAEDLAQDHHVQCYVDSGYCQMEWEEQNKILTVVFWDLIFNSKFQETGLRIQKACQSSGDRLSHW